MTDCRPRAAADDPLHGADRIPGTADETCSEEQIEPKVRRRLIRKMWVTAAILLLIAACADLASLPLNGRWYVAGMEEVQVRFGLITMSNPSAKAFSDTGNGITIVPVAAWSWNGTIHVVPSPFAQQFGRLGGPAGEKTSMLPIRHNLVPGSMHRIDRCTLSVYSDPKIGPWQRIHPSCPAPRHPMRIQDQRRNFSIDYMRFGLVDTGNPDIRRSKTSWKAT